MTTRMRLGSVVAMAIAGAALRGIGLNSGLWYDEIVTLVESVRPPLSQILTAFPGNNNHPLYSVLGHVSIAAFGEHAWTLRLPAVLFGTVAIPLVYWLATRVTTREESLLAALLMAVAYHPVWFSQNARGYTMLLAFTLTTTVFAIDLLERPRIRPALAYALAAGLGVYTHLTMVFVVAAHALVWVWTIWWSDAAQRRQHWQAALCGLGGAALIAVVLYAPMLGEVYAFFSGPPQQTAAVATSSWAALEMLKGLVIGFGGLGLLAALALMGIGGLSYASRTPAIAALFVLPGILTGTAMVVLHAPIRPRFFFMMAGFGLLMLVRGATLCGEWLSRWLSPTRPALTGVAIVILVAAISIWSLGFNYRYPKQDFEGAMRFVEARRQGAEPVGTGGLATYPFETYYRKPWTGVRTATDLNALSAGQSRVWMVYSFPEYMDNMLVAALQRECAIQQTFRGTLGGGDVVVCSIGQR